MLLLAVVFFRSERKELHAIIPQIIAANTSWLFAAFALTIIYFIYMEVCIGKVFRLSVCYFHGMMR